MNAPSRPYRIALVALIATTACARRHPDIRRDAGPPGCCCSYYNCRSDYGQDECARNGEFQGWTYSWHEGACTDADRHPSQDTPASPR
jgi:hypothetical protein